MYDYHVHTSFSTDGSYSMSEMIEAAIDKGFKEIAFTDHIDYDYPDKSIEFLLDFKGYQKALTENKEMYKGKIKIIKGIEIGIQKHVIQECNNVAHAYPYDFIICSMHAAENKDLHNGDYFIDKSVKDAYINYYTYMYDCLKSFKNYCVVGHLNMIDRYKKYMDIEIKYKEYADIVEEILRMIIQDGKGIEVNTSSFRYQMKELSPKIEILKRYKEMSGEIITVGSDAHTPDYIGHKFDYIYDILKKVGFKYVTTYENMVPQFKKI